MMLRLAPRDNDVLRAVEAIQRQMQKQRLLNEGTGLLTENLVGDFVGASRKQHNTSPTAAAGDVL